MAVSKAIDEPQATIRGLRPVRSSKLHRVYEVVLSDGRTLELVMPPPSMLRLLRSERQTVNSESVVVQWLSTLLSQERTRKPGSSQEAVVEEAEGEEGGGASSDRAGRATSRSSSTGSQRRPVENSFSDDKSALLRLYPKFITHSSTSAELGAPYSLYHPRDGTPVASLPRPLTSQERAEIDFQLGCFTRQCSEIKSPTGRFGHAVAVLASSEAVMRTLDGSPSSLPSSSGGVDGLQTWSAAFHLFFEAILRDSEDMAITLPYPLVRKHLARLSYLLDEGIEPSLVFVDGLEDSNVLVVLSSTETEDKERDQESRPNTSSDEDSGDKKREGKTSPDTGDDSRQDSPASPAIDPPIRVVGLRDWSNGVFGDPLFATAFSNSPSRELFNGFHRSTGGGGSLSTNGNEQNVSTKTRLLLYQAYHATVSIVTEFYRPRDESRTRELAARRKLTEALMKLEEVGDEPSPSGSRHRRPSGEMSPAKKLKSEEKDRPSSSRRHETTIQEV